MSTPTKTEAAALPKPRVTARAGDHRSWSIDFGNGARGMITQPWNMRREAFDDKYIWSVGLADGTGTTGEAHGHALAFRCAWSRAARASAPAPVKLSRDQVQAIADQADGTAVDATKAIRKILKARTGFAWSVRVGKGTAYSWLTVTAAPKRHVDGRMSAHDGALLAVCVGDDLVSPSGISVRPGRGVRSALIWDLAGLDRPADHRVAAPSWD